jgi:gliding motility-associated lipoprotein GldB
MKRVLPFLLLAGILSGCGSDEEKCAFIPEVSSADVKFEFETFHQAIASIKSKQELVDLLGSQPMIRDYVFRRTAYPSDSVFINTLYKKFTNPHLDSLLTETERVFGDLSELRSQFRSAFANLKYYYPDFNPPKVQTVISGLDNDLFVSDSLIIVSLDYYLGPGAKYRPQIYEYLLRQYKKENIVPSCMLIYGISERFNKTALTDKSVLADMIAFGKSYYFAKQMLPCVPDSVLTWYTPEEIQGARKNQDLIWARFVEDRVLYSTSHTVKQKFLGERPKTIEVGEKCPGRIGQWVGWQIVNSYMNTHSEISLPQLMDQPDAQKIFRESKYKPMSR